MKPNPLYGIFRAALEQAQEHVRPWKGVAFRSVELGFAKQPHLLSGDGSWEAGGRWNAPKLFRAIYCSLRPGTAVEEAFALAEGFGLAGGELRPRVTVGLEWDLPKVLDLIRAPLPETRDLSAWLKEEFDRINRRGFETVAQAFGRAAWKRGLSGLIVPSARVPGGVNLVVFGDAVREGKTVRVLGGAELARYLR